MLDKVVHRVSRIEDRASNIFVLLLMGAIFFITSAALGSEEIPHVSPEMTEAVYWINRLPKPDQVLLTPSQIERLNQKFLRVEPTAVDPFALPEKVGAPFLLAPIEKEESLLLGRRLYDRRGRAVGRRSIAALKELCGLTKVPASLSPQFGLVVSECSLRTFPTMEPLVEERGKLSIDLLQQTTLHPGTPAAILWQSQDKEWVYLASPLLRGWVQKEYVATFEDKKGLLKYRQWPKLIVVEREAPFYERPDGETVGKWFLGTVLHSSSIAEEGTFYRVTRPARDPSGILHFSPVYVPQRMVRTTFLPLTSRQILTQAFKLHGAPYGWGGLKGGWDCSSFLRDVFLTMGVELPRNSVPQSRVGKVYSGLKGHGSAKKKELLDQGIPAATFLKLDGHIMLYLGQAEGRYYAIHATTGYRKRGNFAKRLVRREKVISIYKVITSDVELGKETQRGSLLERLISINFPFKDPAR